MHKYMSLRKTLKIIFVVFSCVVIFSAGASAYLELNLKKAESEADVKDYTVPYSSIPENCGILFKDAENHGRLVFLDFENLQIKIIKTDGIETDLGTYFGYSADYTVKSDHILLQYIIDLLGGIELAQNDTVLRYTGIQVSQMMQQEESVSEQDIITAVLERISKKGFSKNDFVCIIENSETDLTVPDCFYWEEYIAEMCLRVSFVN